MRRILCAMRHSVTPPGRKARLALTLALLACAWARSGAAQSPRAAVPPPRSAADANEFSAPPLAPNSGQARRDASPAGHDSLVDGVPALASAPASAPPDAPQVTVAEVNAAPNTQAPGAASAAHAPNPQVDAAQPQAGANARDANADRLFWAPSALTPPAATTTFSIYELLWLSASYSPRDDVQLTGGLLIPFSQDMPYVGSLGGKLRFWQSARSAAALHGAVVFGQSGSERGWASMVGGAFTHCLDQRCENRFNAYISAGSAAIENSRKSTLTTALGGTFYLTPHLRGLAEVWAAQAPRTAGATLWSANYGLRFITPTIGVDFGFLKPFIDGETIDELPLGVPWLSFTFRTGPAFL